MSGIFQVISAFGCLLQRPPAARPPAIRAEVSAIASRDCPPRNPLVSDALPSSRAMSAVFLPAVAAGALLALAVQSPPSLNAAQRWLPVVLRQGVPDVFGSLSHRAPRHEASCVLQRSAAFALHPASSAPASSGYPSSAPARAAIARVATTAQQQRGPRRPWPALFHQASSSGWALLSPPAAARATQP